VDTTWRLARCEEALGDPEGRVLRLLQETVTLAVEHGYRVAEAIARRQFGRCLMNRGHAAEARAEIEAALDTFRDLKMSWEAGRTLLALGELTAATSEPMLGAPMLREALGLFDELGAEREAARAAEALATATGESLGLHTGEPFAEILTAADTMREAIERARRIAPSSIPVLVTGETGTGKELFARSIHRSSSRKELPFLAVNCAALSETLLESELFGHEKGAFTGAAGRKIGIFEAANGGTVFLDEVGKAPLSLQAKLLRVLDTGELRRVGAVEAVHVNVRIIAATNRELSALVQENAFLPDLLYRLRGFDIRVPSLRERPDDIALLFEHFAGRPPSDSTLQVLERHDWPGNVREIRNLAESAAFLSLGRGPVPLDALPDWIRRAAVVHAASAASLEQSERSAVLKALEVAGGNRSRAARALGISRQTLYTKMSKFGIGRANAA
jgi:transcriptional regulator with PAS, ATPase and Fis domain